MNRAGHACSAGGPSSRPPWSDSPEPKPRNNGQDNKGESNQAALGTLPRLLLAARLQLFRCAIRVVPVACQITTKVAHVRCRPIAKAIVRPSGPTSVQMTVIHPPDRRARFAQVDRYKALPIQFAPLGRLTFSTIAATDSANTSVSPPS
jgi:hypothetical protein